MAGDFFVNSNIVFGRDAINRLPLILKEYNPKSVMIVCDAGVKIAGIVETVIAKITSTDTKVTVFDKTIQNPTNELAEEAVVIAKNEGIDLFVAVGGGSSIDLAKAINILMTNPGPIELYGGIGLVKNSVLPLIAIPTTAGTSSEITNVCALIDTKSVRKYVIIDNKIVAERVVADPEFTRTMPPSITAATGMDAVTHAVESYISNMSTPLTEYNSINGLKILYKNLPRVFFDGNDIQAREQMMLGCIITGFGFSNANLGLVHAIAHTLSAHFYLAHGMANAAVLPFVMEYNADSVPEKMVKMAEAIHLPLSGDIEKDKYLLSKELQRLTGMLGIKKLSGQGIREKDLAVLTDDVLKEPVLSFNPKRNVTRDDILNILYKAF
jgi:alcohol dehydrogenase